MKRYHLIDPDDQTQIIDFVHTLVNAEEKPSTYAMLVENIAAGLQRMRQLQIMSHENNQISVADYVKKHWKKPAD